ncbi:MAG: efflux RND transporter periplasmic adaptor subunit [bacterium]
MKKLLLIFVVVVAAGLGGWRVYEMNKAARQAGPGRKQAAGAVPVTVADVIEKAMPVVLRTFGTVEAFETASIKPQAGGLVTNVHFVEGQNLRAGDLLFTLDARPAQAQLRQAEANLARDAAQFDNAEKEARRQEELLKKGFTAEDARDQAHTASLAMDATVKADEAVVENARLLLEYNTIRAPFDGRAGARLVDSGNVVKANETVLLVLNRITPARVSFAVPQQDLLQLMPASTRGLLVKAVIGGDTNLPETGTVTFINNEVDKTTGTLQVKGTFSNETKRLWPGQFVRVELTLLVETGALVVPSSSVLTGQKGTYLYVVKPDQTVEDRVVTVKRIMDEETVLASGGVKPGERVVTDGQLRLAPGIKVEVNDGLTKQGVAKP